MNSAIDKNVVDNKKCGVQINNWNGNHEIDFVDTNETAI